MVISGFSLAAVAAVAACRPTSTPTSLVPTPDAARIAAFSAQLTAAVPRALTSPTPTVTPTDEPEPLTVGVSLAEAEREVLSWLDPSREPRIEWSQYVRRSDLGADGVPLLRDTYPDLFHDQPVAGLGDPLIVVVASTRGIDPLGGPARDWNATCTATGPADSGVTR